MNEALRVLDLFSGIGGFSLGLERAGMRTVAFCEIDAFCRRVLAKHWPHVPRYHDVRTLTAERLRAGGIVPNVICGGFPCQDISLAGNGAGIAGKRSGLWGEYVRIIGEVRPRFVIVENVAALLGRGLDRVLGDLAALGYDAEWHCIPASAIGAPHRRDRVWIVAYPCGGELRDEQQWMPGRRADGTRDQGQAEPGNNGAARPLPDTDGGRCGGQWQPEHADQQGTSGREPDGFREAGWREWPAVADTDGRGRREQWHVGETSCDERTGQSEFGRGTVPLPCRPRLALGPGTLREWAHAATTGAGWWAVEPDVGRVVDGPAARLDRRKRLIALGNGLVPQIPEIIGRAIVASI